MRRLKQFHAGQEQRMGSEISLESDQESLIVDQVRRMAYLFARRLTSKDEADDIAQDVALDYLLKVRDKHWRLETTQEALVASMTWRKHACRTRRAKHRRAAEEQFMAERNARTPDWMHPASDCEAREDVWIQEQTLKELSATARIAFRMVNEQGATHGAVARTMGVSREAVTKQLRKAEKRLADRLLSVRALPTRRSA
jgi:RNA polymerase sigma factor (sigma-70 family)